MNTQTEIRAKYGKGLFLAYNAKQEVLTAVFADDSDQAHEKIDRLISEPHTVGERWYFAPEHELTALNNLESQKREVLPT